MRIQKKAGHDKNAFPQQMKSRRLLVKVFVLSRSCAIFLSGRDFPDSLDSLMSRPVSKLSVEENVPLAPLTTLRVGGPARFFIRVQTEEQIGEGLDFARKRSCPVFILGGGSNLVVADSGFPGVVLKIELSGIESHSSEAEERVSAAAGQEWDRFVQYCVDRNLAGIECLSGIPGTVGATPVQNVGAYGEEASEVILRIRVLDRSSYSILHLSNADCRFSYRTSVFNTIYKDRYIVLKVDFVLRPDGKPCLRYEDLRRHFAGRSESPSIREVREAVLQIRKGKGMLLDEPGSDSNSVGSFFKNPIWDPEKTAALEKKARACGILESKGNIPRFQAPSGQEKLAAAWLVERAGFCKGYRFGNAGISDKHSLALINYGGATAQEIVDLMHVIQTRVRTLFGIELQPEPTFVGFDRI
jgi:UDP-N-acetylmuramate dehydrogenase